MPERATGVSTWVGALRQSLPSTSNSSVARPAQPLFQPKGSYYVDAPGMDSRNFRLPPDSKALRVRVTGASATPRILSGWAIVLGGAAAITGGILWGVYGAADDVQLATTDSAGKVQYHRESNDTSAYQTLTFVGGGVLIAGVVGLILLPRTHVDTESGVRLDAHASRPATSRVRFTANGFVF